MAIKNRYEFMYFVECINGNPNGDPDMGNSPRIDPQDMHGIMTDVSVKRRIRNYVQLAHKNTSPFSIMVQQSTNLNRFIVQAYESTEIKSSSKTKNDVKEAQRWLCKNYYDVRTFGGVLSTGPNAGQIRGPVQLTFLRSVDPVLPLDISITRMAVAENLKENSTSEDYLKWEESQPEDKLRTMGRKQLIPYGLYVGRGFISANLADETGFDDNDLELFWEALLNMYEHDRSSSKGHMSTIAPLILFRHVGTDSNEEQKQKQAKLGCAPAHRLFDLVEIKRKAEISVPRKYHDYDVIIDLRGVPGGVEVGFAYPSEGKVNIAWNDIPAELEWIRTK